MDQVKCLVAPALRAEVERLCPDVARVASYHHGWVDEHGRATNGSGGKALRSALALLSARAAGATPERGVPAAVAVELVHNFSLLHDDIMDGDTERRHRPTAWTVFGTSRAILAGDALLTAALNVLLEQSEPGAAAASSTLLACTQRLIAGQAADLDFEQRHDVTVAECLRMASDKTGALLACACSVGAMLAGAGPGVVRGLTGFGEQLGVAFQLVDDLLGIWGRPERTGKPVLSDLRTRKKSLPVVAALAAGRTESELLARLYFRPEPLDEGDLIRAAELVEAAGGRAWTDAEATRRIELAVAHLDGLPMPGDVRDELVVIAGYVTERRH